MILIFFFKQKTAYEMRISDWSSDVCSSDLGAARLTASDGAFTIRCPGGSRYSGGSRWATQTRLACGPVVPIDSTYCTRSPRFRSSRPASMTALRWNQSWLPAAESRKRSEEHTSELQSLMRISYAVFCL